MYSESACGIQTLFSFFLIFIVLFDFSFCQFVVTYNLALVIHILVNSKQTNLCKVSIYCRFIFHIKGKTKLKNPHFKE